jgi:hypothetical protein
MVEALYSFLDPKKHIQYSEKTNGKNLRNSLIRPCFSLGCAYVVSVGDRRHNTKENEQMDMVKIQFLECGGLLDRVVYEDEISFTRK